MARRETLLNLLQDFRSEAGLSSNPASNVGVREAQVRRLQTQQEWLWRKEDWPHLRVERFFELQAGQRYYDTPDDLPFDRIEKVEVRYGDAWVPLCPTIEAKHYALHDSYTDQRSWPVERWQIYEDEQMEMWPIPSSNSSRYVNPASSDIEGQIRLTGIRKLNPLIDDDDRCDLDAELIVGFAAARELASKGAPDAEIVQQKANLLLNDLTGGFSKIQKFRVGGNPTKPKYRAPIPTVHYRET